MAEVEKLNAEVASISESFKRLERLVGNVSEQLSVSQRFSQTQTQDGECGNVGRRQVATDEQQHQLMPNVMLGKSEVQAEFRSIRDSVSKVKLPPDVTVSDSRAGVSRADLPKFHIIQKSARYQETVLKLLPSCDLGDTAVSPISAVSLAHVHLLQEEYMQLMVGNQFDDGTARLFSALQQNPAAFTPNSLENPRRAVSIAGAQNYHQVSASRSRGFFPSWGGSRLPGRAFPCGLRRGGGFGFQSADWGQPRGQFDLDMSRTGRGPAGWPAGQGAASPCADD